MLFFDIYLLKRTLQKGYPVLNVTRDENNLKVEQNWFLLNPLNTVSPDEFNRYRWYVPFTYTTQKELDFSFNKTATWFRANDSSCNFFLFFIYELINSLISLTFQSKHQT